MDIEVRPIARHAKLKLDEDKVDMFRQQMNDIVDMVENLPPVDAEMKAPDKNDAMLLREDVPKPSPSRDELLRGAPQKQAGCFVVPRTL